MVKRKRDRESSAAESGSRPHVYPTRKRVRRAAGSRVEAKQQHADSRKSIKTMMQLYRCSTKIEGALRKHFVPIAVFVHGDCEEYKQYKLDQSRRQTTLLFDRGSLSFSRDSASGGGGNSGAARDSPPSTAHTVEIFDDDSLEIQAAIEFGVFRHQAQLGCSHRCELVYSTIAADLHSVTKFWNCVRTGARLRCRLLAIDIHRPGKRILAALDQATHSLSAVGYTTCIASLGARRRLLLSVPLDEHESEQRMLDLDAVHRQQQQQQHNGQQQQRPRGKTRSSGKSLSSPSSQSAKILQFVKTILK